MNQHTNTHWTPQVCDRLTQLWTDGVGATEIAARLNRDAGVIGLYTRNAVIGKAHRLKLASKPSPLPTGSAGRWQGSWTARMTEALREEWGGKMTAQEIADGIGIIAGYPVSKGSIRSKATALGLRGGRAADRSNHATRLRAPKHRSAPKPLPKANPMASSREPVTLEQAQENRSCRFQVNGDERPRLYCPNPIAPGSRMDFCEHHGRLAISASFHGVPMEAGRSEAPCRAYRGCPTLSR